MGTVGAPLAADVGGTAAPLAAASAAVPNPAMGFAGGFPASGDVLTASAPSILPGGNDLLAAGAVPTPAADPFNTGSWGGAFPGTTTPPGAVPAFGAATADPNAAPPTAQQGLDYIYSQPGLQPYDPNVAGAADAWAQAQKVGTYTPTPPQQQSIMSQITQGAKEYAPLAQLGVAGTGLAVGLSDIHQSLPASAQAAQANAQALANQGANLNPSQQAVLGQMRQNLTNQWKQTLYNQHVMAGKGGVPMSTQWPQIQGLIDQQVSAAAQQMIQQNISNALQGDQQLISLANLQMQQDRNFQQTLQNATHALGLAAGLGGATKTTTTTTSSS